jgi:hypothetical protein
LASDGPKVVQLSPNRIGIGVFAAWAIFHDHRLTPARGQTLRKEARCGVGCAARRQRQDDPDCALRPGLGVR